jgi:hypothetical protein
MVARLTKDTVLERLAKKDIELLEDYIVGTDNSHSNKKCKCLICHYGSNGEWGPNLSNLFGRSRCINCAGLAPLTKEQVVKRLKAKNIELLDDYIIGMDGVDSNKKCKCMACNYGENKEWGPNLTDVLYSTGCPSCGGTMKQDNDIVDQRLLVVNRQIKRLGNYINIDTKISWECLINKCGNIWFATPDKILNSGRGCPKCSKHKNQKLMFSILYEFNNDFEDEYSLININKSARPKFKFDAYLPKYNIAFEYDGEQHYQATRFFDMTQKQAKIKLKKTQKCDNYKNNFCIENNIFLIRIDGRIYKDKKLEQLMQDITNTLKHNLQNIYQVIDKHNLKSYGNFISHA